MPSATQPPQAPGLLDIDTSLDVPLGWPEPGLHQEQDIGSGSGKTVDSAGPQGGGESLAQG